LTTTTPTRSCRSISGTTTTTTTTTTTNAMATKSVPRPAPANLTPNSSLDEWLEEAKQCHYLPESVMKELCEKVKEVLMEGKIFLPALFSCILSFEMPSSADTTIFAKF
jgi:hypothetical protein